MLFGNDYMYALVYQHMSVMNYNYFLIKIQMFTFFFANCVMRLDSIAKHHGL